MTKVGIRRGRLTDGETAEIERLAQRNWPSGRIAGRLNRHPATISYAMQRAGLKASVPRTFDYWRGGVHVKSFSAEEDRRIVEWRAAGVAPAVIATRLTAQFGHRRSEHTIRVRLVLIAARDENAG